MKQAISIIILLISIALISGCCEDPCGRCNTHPPREPRGVYSVTNDREIELYWEHNIESDLEGYHIYWSSTLNGYYEYLDSTPNNYYYDIGLRNGYTTYYAISAFDCAGNESALNYEIVYDTPRPEGYNLRVYDIYMDREYSGIDFSKEPDPRDMIQDYRFSSTDVYVNYDDGVYYLDVADYYTGEPDPNTFIQDYGYTRDLQDVDVAPTGGWYDYASLDLIVGHTYLVWTRDNHFAALRIIYIENGYVIMDWSYQTDWGNPELKILNNKEERQVPRGRRTSTL